MSYSLRLLDAEGRVVSHHALLLQDDLDALDEAVRRSDSQAVEIWQGPRLVARVKPGNAPLDVRDPRSL